MIKERVLLLTLGGEQVLAANLRRHVLAWDQRQSAKHAGSWGAESWRIFFSDSLTFEAQDLTLRARERKRELGWLGAPPTDVESMRTETFRRRLASVGAKIQAQEPSEQLYERSINYAEGRQLYRDRQEVRRQQDAELARDAELVAYRESLNVRAAPAQPGPLSWAGVAGDRAGGPAYPEESRWSKGLEEGAEEESSHGTPTLGARSFDGEGGEDGEWSRERRQGEEDRGDDEYAEGGEEYEDQYEQEQYDQGPPETREAAIEAQRKRRAEIAKGGGSLIFALDELWIGRR